MKLSYLKVNLDTDMKHKGESITNLNLNCNESRSEASRALCAGSVGDVNSGLSVRCGLSVR